MRFYELVRDLRNQGVPIHGAGLQSHFDARYTPSVPSLTGCIQRLGALGLRVHISEMDVQIAGLDGDYASRLERQRQIYRDVVGVCVREPACEAVTFWGFDDGHSWIRQVYGPDDPLPFDAAYNRKPAYYGIVDALLGR